MNTLDKDLLNEAVEDIKDLIHENIENGFEGWEPDANDLCFQLAFMRDEYRNAVYGSLSNKEKQFVNNISAEIEEAREGKWSLHNLREVLFLSHLGKSTDEDRNEVYIFPLEDGQDIHLMDELSVKDMKSLAFDARIDSSTDMPETINSLHIIDRAGKEYNISLDPLHGTVEREGLSVTYTRSYGVDQFDFNKDKDWFSTEYYKGNTAVLHDAQDIAQILNENQFDAKALHYAINEHYNPAVDEYGVSWIDAIPDNYEAFKTLFKIQDEIANENTSVVITYAKAINNKQNDFIVRHLSDEQKRGLQDLCAKGIEDLKKAMKAEKEWEGKAEKNCDGPELG